MTTLLSLEEKPALRYLLPLFPKSLAVFTEDNFWFNPLEPVKGVKSHRRTLEAVADTFSFETELRLPSSILFADACMEECQRRKTLENSGNNPCIKDVFERLKRKNFHALDRRKRSWESLIHRLGDIINSMPTMCVSKGIPIEHIDSENCVIELNGAPRPTRRFVFACALNRLYRYREAKQLRGESVEPKLIIIDEASTVFPASIGPDSTSSFDDILTYGRERKLQVLALTQYVKNSQISSSLVENTQIKILLGGLGDASTYWEFGKTLGATKEEIEDMARHRTPGQGYASDYRVGHPFRFTFPDTSYLKKQPVSQELIRERVEEALKSIKIIPPVHPDWRPGLPFEWKPEQNTSKQEPAQKPETQKKENIKAKISISEDAQKTLKYWVEKQQQAFAPGGKPLSLLGLHHGFDALSISGGSQRCQIIKELEHLRLGVQHLIRVGKGTPAVLEITERGWELLGINKPALKGKGGWLHQYLSLVVKQRLEHDGYRAEIEGSLCDRESGLKQCDVLARHHETGDALAVEIGISSPQQEILNAKQDILGQTPADKLLVCGINSKMLRIIEQKFAECPELQPVMNKIEFSLVGRFFQK